MASELIINATLPETRIALLENGEIQELYIERDTNKGIVGNIYKGRVIRVLPGMQAAFVDIGLEKAAFLYVDDVFFPDMQTPLRMPDEEQQRPHPQKKRREAATPSAESGEDENVGISEGGSAPQDSEVAIAQGAENADISLEALEPSDIQEPADLISDVVPEGVDDESDDEDGIISVAQRRKNGENINIQDVVREGQEILVQVAKDPIGTKGARLTCHVSLPGRYLVFMPTVDHVGVSRRIENDGERRRLKKQIVKFRPPKTGFIVRTASSAQDDQKIRADIEYLVNTWNDVQDKYNGHKAPNLVYQDYTLTIRAIRDMMTEEVDKLVVDSKSEFKQIMKFVQRFMPQVRNKIELYDRATPVFEYYGIELELSRALERKVWLKSGGYLMIDQSEALIAIDVNTGRFVGKKNLEDTILKTNLEAVKEIAYQLRLRNCGGIIILDLIDMEKEVNRERVYQALEEAIKQDRARPTILKISQLGLVEMTRKRTRESMIRTLGEPCPYCEGRGFIKNKITVCYEILREVEREGYNRETSELSVDCHPAVADLLAGDQGSILEDIENRFGKRVQVQANNGFHLEQFEIIAQRGERRMTVKERKKDAKHLGHVVPLSDEIQDTHGHRRDSLGRSEAQQMMEALPFMNEDQAQQDGDRELREERVSDRQRRSRRGSSSSHSSKKRPSKRQDENASSDDVVPHARNSQAGHDSEDGENPNEFQTNDSRDSNDGYDQEGSETSSHSEEGREPNPTQIRGNTVTIQPREQKEIEIPAHLAGPKNYEEYIATTPEPGTELTRSEWETENHSRLSSLRAFFAANHMSFGGAGNSRNGQNRNARGRNNGARDRNASEPGRGGDFQRRGRRNSRRGGRGRSGSGTAGATPSSGSRNHGNARG